MPSHPAKLQAPTLTPNTNNTWQQALQQAYRDPTTLLNDLQLNPDHFKLSQQQSFSMRVPLGFAGKMQRANPNDPLLLQVLPLANEDHNSSGFFLDPVGDAAARAEHGIIHKYQGRALLVTTGACAVHCRYCFRRHYPYSDEKAAASNWQNSLNWLKQQPSIHEVILSGGDPLSLTDTKLKPLMQGLAQIAHIHTVRIHSRQPVVLPERITSSLLNTLHLAKKKLVLVIHANHAQELADDTAAALKQCRDANMLLLNQSVLLKGVNNSVSALKALSQKLFEQHTLPYYLHQLDRVQGAAHFEVPLPQAQQLHHQLATQLPGYLVPKLVQEQAGQPNKTLINRTP